MSRNDKSKLLDNLVFDYIQYEIDTPGDHINKECEVRFCTKHDRHISKHQFDNTISKLRSCGFTSENVNGDNLMRISMDNSDRKIGNIRLELVGEHLIQNYCKNENLLNLLQKEPEHIGIVKKYYPKKNGSKYKPYDNADFDFRVSFQLEEKISHEDPSVMNTLMTNYTNISKYYRYINRIEYIHPDFPFKCHFSLVKNSKSMAQNMKKSGVFDSNIRYEIELEIDNDRVNKFEQPEVVRLLRILTKYILSGIQDSKYPISYREIDAKKMEYLDLFGIENTYDKVRPTDFIGYSSVTLKLLNVQENEFGNDVNIRKHYTVTEKADGSRKLLYIDGKGTIYTIDTQLNVQFTGMHTKVEDIYNTVLDGEHIKYDKSGKYINLYAAFDVYVLNKIDKRGEIFVGTNKEGKRVGRLPLLEKIIKSMKMISGVNVKENAFEVQCKRFYTDEGGSIFDSCAMIMQRQKDKLYPYEIDGLIFTPADKAIPIANRRITWDASFKWKPPKFNTIDFLVKYAKENGRGVERESLVKGPYKNLHLYCGFSGGYIDPLNDVLDYNSKMYSNENDKRKKKRDIDRYRPVLFVPTQPYDEKAYECNVELSYDSNGLQQLMTDENELIQDNTIVEFAYDVNEKEPHFQWKPLRVRYDKTQQLRDGHNNFGNNYDTANNNWNTIHNPVTQEMITTGLNIPLEADDDVYYNRKSNSTSTRALRDFHNLVVKSLLIDTVSKEEDTLMDFAVGKGGDMPKWIHSKLSFVYGIDISRDNIENKKDGACARFLNYAMRNQFIPEMIFTAGDSSKNIRSGDALLDDKYRLINDAVFGKGSRDKMKMGYNLFKNYGKGSDGFQITSCQFALHYFFESKYTLENFISNVVECTKLGGYFIGTSYDGQILFDMLKRYNKGEGKVLRDDSGKIMWEITKQYDREEFNNDGSCIGYSVDVYQESINKTFREYLVNYDYFNDLMNAYGFTLVPKDEIKSLGLNSSNGLFSELFKHVKEANLVNDKYKKNKLGTSLQMTDNEKEISFLNRYFVYKKTRKYVGDINIFTNENAKENTMGQDIEEDIIEEKEKK